MIFLIFQHVPHEHPGLIADFAKRNKIKLDIVKFWKGYKIPSIKNYNAIIILGGPMGVYEGMNVFPSKDRELNIIKENLGKIPMLGLCLGSQLLAHALGATVKLNIIKGKHLKEIGYYQIELTNSGKKDQLFDGFPPFIKAFEWHGDAFTLPKDASLLASSKRCKNQAFVYKNAYGLLFHLEFTTQMVKKQIEIDQEWIHKDFNLNEMKLNDEANSFSSHMKLQSERLLNNFLQITKT